MASAKLVAQQIANNAKAVAQRIAENAKQIKALQAKAAGVYQDQPSFEADASIRAENKQLRAQNEALLTQVTTLMRLLEESYEANGSGGGGVTDDEDDDDDENDDDGVDVKVAPVVCASPPKQGGKAARIMCRGVTKAGNACRNSVNCDKHKAENSGAGAAHQMAPPNTCYKCGRRCLPETSGVMLMANGAYAPACGYHKSR